MRASNTPTPSINEHAPTSLHSPALIEPPFPVTVRGKDARGNRFAAVAALAMLHAHSLSLRLARTLEPSTALFIVFSIGAHRSSGVVAPAVAIRGMVLWSTPHPNGGYLVAIQYDRHRFLFPHDHA